MSLRQLGCAALLGLAVSTQAHAAVFDAAADFSAASNPNGVWSYGWSSSLQAPLTLYTGTTSRGTDGIVFWIDPALGTDPSVAKNVSGLPVADATVTGVFYPPDQMTFHPGPSGQYSLVRWTSPIEAQVGIEALFTGGSFVAPWAPTTDVHVLLNGSPLFDAILRGSPSSIAFARTIDVGIGDRVDFAVGFGPDASYISDTTSLTARIVPIPEPASIGILGLGWTALLLLRRRS